MTILRCELRRGRKGFWIWTLAIASLLVICVALFPEMKGEMAGVSDVFANMGAFTQAFGMDRLDFGTFIGYYGVECGNMLGIGGGFFAAYLGVSMLSKEEQEHTAEFLLTHPVSRWTVVGQKLLAVMLEVAALNLVILAASGAAILIIGEQLPGKELLLLHGAYLILQLEISLLCFGLSAFLRRGSVGVGLGLAAVLYFMNLVGNLSDAAQWVRYVTPFAYAEPARLLDAMALDQGLVVLGCGYAVITAAVGAAHYVRKDIAP